MPQFLNDYPPSWEDPIEAATNGDAFSLVRGFLLKTVRRTSWLRGLLAGGAQVLEHGTTSEMQAIASPATGNSFLVARGGLYVFNGSSIATPSAPWVYAPNVGAGRWHHVLDAVTGVEEGVDANGFVQLGPTGNVLQAQIAHATAGRWEWLSTTLSQTLTTAVGYQDVTGASLALGSCEAGDSFDVDFGFGSVTNLYSSSDLRVVIYEAATPATLLAVPGAALFIPVAGEGASPKHAGGFGRIDVLAAGTYTLKVQAHVGAMIEPPHDPTTVSFAGTGRLFARRFRA